MTSPVEMAARRTIAAAAPASMSLTMTPLLMTLTDNGVAPTDDAESALVQTLAPGNFTAIVQGFNGATGDALVEAYAIGPAAP